MFYQHAVITILLAWPLAAGVGILFVPPRLAKHLALAATLVELAVALPMWWVFDPAAGSQFSTDLPWMTAWGIRYIVGTDEIGRAHV